MHGLKCSHRSSVCSKQERLVRGAIGGRAHCNGWNIIHGTESNMV
jgi:hypothetical protein